MADEDCMTFVPFAQYDWTFARTGWLPWNPTAFCLIASFCAVAYWMSIELLVLVWVTFKRHSGVYFWSIIITTLGLILQTTGYILKSFENSCPDILVTIICKVGWVANVTGFSIVLWSRLHLVVNSRRLLKVLLWVILINGFVCHTPIVVCEFGLLSNNRKVYFDIMVILERVQQTAFTIQETTISAMYIYFTARFLNNGHATQTRKVVSLLVAVQITVVALDILLTVFDYHDMFTLKCTIHPFVYSIKLKLEFIVLNQLQQIVKRGLAPGLNLKTISSGSESGREHELAGDEKVGSNTEVGKDFVAEVKSTASPLSSTSIADSVNKVEQQNDQSGEKHVEEETDLVEIVGSPDDAIEYAEMDDLERQYLGRYGNRSEK